MTDGWRKNRIGGHLWSVMSNDPRLIELIAVQLVKAFWIMYEETLLLESGSASTSAVRNRGKGFHRTPIFHVPNERRVTAAVENLPVIALEAGTRRRGAGLKGMGALISRGMVKNTVLNGLAFQSWTEDLHADPVISEIDLSKPTLDQLLGLPAHKRLRDNVIRHLQPQMLRSDEDLRNLWELRCSGSSEEYREALNTPYLDDLYD